MKGRPGIWNRERPRSAPGMVGKVYANLLVLADAGKRGKLPVVLCRCVCGAECLMGAMRIRDGRTKSCGCVGKLNQKLATTTHGKSNTRAFRVHKSMLERCFCTTHHAFADYGGRGISVCEPWRAFVNFYADMGDPPMGMQLERIDNDGDYSPSNCKWATSREQNQNKRSNRYITFRGETKCQSEWARVMGIQPGLIAQRLKAGWTVEEALLRPAVPPHARRNRSLIRLSNIPIASTPA